LEVDALLNPNNLAVIAVGVPAVVGVLDDPGTASERILDLIEGYLLVLGDLGALSYGHSCASVVDGLQLVLERHILHVLDQNKDVIVLAGSITGLDAVQSVVTSTKSHLNI
jgi:hypothetical protein